MKNLTFKQVCKFEAEIVLYVYTALLALDEVRHADSFMELLEEVIEDWLDPQVLAYAFVSIGILIFGTLIVCLLRGFFYWLEIQAFNRKSRR